MGVNRCICQVIRLVVVVAAVIVPGSEANTYHVGDVYGWQTPTSGFNYTNWATQHSFVAGDILTFDFNTGQHTAAKVTQTDYSNCNTANALTVEVNGPANYTLTAGSSYFICTMIGHCGQGQKLTVTVAASSLGIRSPTSSPAPPPSPPGTNRPPPSSAMSTAVPVVASSLVFLPIFMTFFS